MCRSFTVGTIILGTHRLSFEFEKDEPPGVVSGTGNNVKQRCPLSHYVNNRNPKLNQPLSLPLTETKDSRERGKNG